MVCDTQVFSRATQHAMAQLSEDEISFELIEVKLCIKLTECSGTHHVVWSALLSPGYTELHQVLQYSRSCAHLSSWMECHLFSTSTSSLTPCVWYAHDFLPISSSSISLVVQDPVSICCCPVTLSYLEMNKEESLAPLLLGLPRLVEVNNKLIDFH